MADVKLDDETLAAILSAKISEGQKFTRDRRGDLMKVLGANLKRVGDRANLSDVARKLSTIWLEGKDDAHQRVSMLTSNPKKLVPYFRWKVDGRVKIALTDSDLLRKMKERVDKGMPLDDLFNDVEIK